MKLKKFSFLTNDQIFGENKLDIFNEYSTICNATDFSILLGGFATKDYSANQETIEKENIAPWWTESSDKLGCVNIVHFNGTKKMAYLRDRSIGARPALPYSSIEEYAVEVKSSSDNIKEVTYGEYPQTVVEENYSSILESAYKKGGIEKTGKVYTTDSIDVDGIEIGIKEKHHYEYVHNGKKYIRFVHDINLHNITLSDGRIANKKEVYWLSVDPITWIVDQNAGIALSKNILFAGLQFHNYKIHENRFEIASIKEFLNLYFAASIENFDRDNLQTQDIEEDFQEEKSRSR